MLAKLRHPLSPSRYLAPPAPQDLRLKLPWIATKSRNLLPHLLLPLLAFCILLPLIWIDVHVCSLRRFLDLQSDREDVEYVSISSIFDGNFLEQDFSHDIRQYFRYNSGMFQRFTPGQRVYISLPFSRMCHIFRVCKSRQKSGNMKTSVTKRLHYPSLRCLMI